jgi:hypothetical protein
MKMKEDLGRLKHECVYTFLFWTTISFNGFEEFRWSWTLGRTRARPISRSKIS